MDGVSPIVIGPGGQDMTKIGHKGSSRDDSRAQQQRTNFTAREEEEREEESLETKTSFLLHGPRIDRGITRGIHKGEKGYK